MSEYEKERFWCVIAGVFCGIILGIALMCIFIKIANAQEITMQTKDYGICKVIGGQIVMWQDGDTIRAKSVDTKPSQYKKEKPKNEEIHWSKHHDNPYANVPPEKLASEREKEGYYYEAGNLYRKAGMEEKAREMFIARAEEHLTEFGHDDSDGLALASNNYAEARMYDKAIELREKAKQICIDKGRFKDALFEGKRLEELKKEKEFYKQLEGEKP